MVGCEKVGECGGQWRSAIVAGAQASVWCVVRRRRTARATHTFTLRRTPPPPSPPLTEVSLRRAPEAHVFHQETLVQILVRGVKIRNVPWIWVGVGGLGRLGRGRGGGRATRGGLREAGDARRRDVMRGRGESLDLPNSQGTRCS